MRLHFHKLHTHLQQQLLPMYLVSGDEPLQCNEALDAIRTAARSRGYIEREILDHDKNFDWQQLAEMANVRSLFGTQRLIELRLSVSKIGNDGSAAIVEWSNHPPPDTLLIISSPKLERAQMTSKWIQALEQHGGAIYVWPIEKQQLASWLEQRLQTRGFVPDKGVAAWLAEQVEGNLLAGAQEIEKLALLQNKVNISLEQIMQVVSDSSRFNIFELADAVIDGDAKRCLRILHALRDEGEAEALVLWVLVKEMRLLNNLITQIKHGTNMSQLITSKREIRTNRHSSYIKALARIQKIENKGMFYSLINQCLKADLSIKGQSRDNAWLILENIALNMTGVVPF